MAQRKHVFLIRHGESIAQGYGRKLRWRADSDFLRDAALAPSGEIQASSLRNALAPSPELVVCSPLTRAMQTALLAFGDVGVPIVPHPALREVPPRGYGPSGTHQQPECRGRPAKVLLADARLVAAGLIDARVDWALLPAGEEAWWSDAVEEESAFEKRLVAFSCWLLERREASVAVVCHFNVIQHLLRIRGLKVENCRPFICEVVAHGESVEWKILEEYVLGGSCRTGSAALEPAAAAVPADVASTVVAALPAVGRGRWGSRRSGGPTVDGVGDVASEHSGSATDHVTRPRAFLVNHGSFNPPHLGHVAMMEQAKRRLEDAGFCVTVGVLALTNSGHIRSKGAHAFEDDKRAHFCTLISQGAGWLSCDRRGVKYGSSKAMLRSVLQAEHPDEWGFSVIGADVARRYGAKACTVVVGRVGDELPCEDLDQWTFCAEGARGEVAAFSSTAVREALAAGDSAALGRLCGPAVAAALTSDTAS